jgi:hypothetical protein
MAFLKKLGLFVFGTGGLIFLNIAVTSAVIASIHELGYWGYPALFGFNMILIGVVFTLLPAPNQPEHFLIRRFPRLKKIFVVDAKRLDKPLWRWARSKGAYPLTQLFSLFIGPTYAAALIRLVLLLPNRQAWRYGILTTLVSTVLVVSLYLGLIEVVRDHLLSLASR